MQISERIFKILSERGMTQKEFSDQTGIKQSTISDWKRKKTNPGADKIKVICDVLGISPEELLQDTGKGEKKEIDYVITKKGTEEYTIVMTLRQMSQDQKKRVLGYVEALKELNQELNQEK